MNKVERIHIARASYEIDVEAAVKLKKYLEAVEKSLGDQKDAMEDIEIRITEILAERGVHEGGVVLEIDVDLIKDKLGDPKVFSSDDADDSTEEKTQSSGARPSRKYYRDTENGILGGVVAGFAAYTGWDVTVLRLILVILAIGSFGSLFLVYLVLWFVAPEASTVGEKLEMRGEAVNVDSIKKAAKDFSEQVKEKGEEVVKNIKKKDKIKQPLSVLARAFGVCFGIFGLIVAFSLIIAQIVVGTEVVTAIMSANVASATLLLVSVGLALALVAVLLVAFLVSSASLIVGRTSSHHRGGGVALLVCIMLLLAGTIGTFGAWYGSAGRGEVNKIIDVLRDKREIEIDGHRFCIGICI